MTHKLLWGRKQGSVSVLWFVGSCNLCYLYILTPGRSRVMIRQPCAAVYPSMSNSEQKRARARERENHEASSVTHQLVLLSRCDLPLLDAPSAFVCFGITRSFCREEEQVSGEHFWESTWTRVTIILNKKHKDTMTCIQINSKLNNNKPRFSKEIRRWSNNTTSYMVSSLIWYL